MGEEPYADRGTTGSDLGVWYEEKRLMVLDSYCPFYLLLLLYHEYRMTAIYAMGENSKDHSIDDRGVHDGRRIIWLHEMNDKTLNPFIYNI